MKLDFSVTNLVNPQSQCIGINTILIDFIKLQQKLAGLNNVQLIKCMGFSNTNKALRRLRHFEQTGQLPEIYTQKLSEVLGFDSADIKQLETQHLKNRFADLQLFIRHFVQIWSHRKIIVRHREYANISFPGLYLSVAYLNVPNYNLGILLQHYMNGDWVYKDICCGDFYLIGAGGSPLSGNNSAHGFCIVCRKHLTIKRPTFGMILKAHKELEVASEQRLTDKTLADLLRAFPS